MIQAALSNLLVVVLFISLACWIASILLRSVSAFNALSRTRSGGPSTLFEVGLQRLVSTPLSEVLRECQTTAKQGVHMVVPSVILPISCSTVAPLDAPAIFPAKSHGLQRWGMRRRATAAVQRLSSASAAAAAATGGSKRPSFSQPQLVREGRGTPPPHHGAGGGPSEDLLTSPIAVRGAGGGRTPPSMVQLSAGQQHDGTAGSTTPLGAGDAPAVATSSSRGIAAFLRTVWSSPSSAVHRGSVVFSSGFSEVAGASVSAVPAHLTETTTDRRASYALPPALSNNGSPSAAGLAATPSGGYWISGVDSTTSTSTTQHRDPRPLPRPLDGSVLLIPSATQVTTTGVQCTTPPMLQFALPAQHQQQQQQQQQSSSSTVGGGGALHGAEPPTAAAFCAMPYRVSILLTSEECLEEELLYAAGVFRHERSLWLTGHGAPVAQEQRHARRGSDGAACGSLRVCTAASGGADGNNHRHHHRHCRCHVCGTQMVPPRRGASTRGGGAGIATSTAVATDVLPRPPHDAASSPGRATSSHWSKENSTTFAASPSSNEAAAAADAATTAAVECRVAFTSDEWAALTACAAVVPGASGSGDKHIRRAYLVIEELDCAAVATPPKGLRSSPNVLEASSAAAVLSSGGSTGADGAHTPSCTLIYQLQLSNVKSNNTAAHDHHHNAAGSSSASVVPIVSESSETTTAADHRGGSAEEAAVQTDDGDVVGSGGAGGINQRTEFLQRTKGTATAVSPSPTREVGLSMDTDAVALPTILEQTAQFASGMHGDDGEECGEEMVSLLDAPDHCSGGGVPPFHLAATATPDVSLVLLPPQSMESVQSQVDGEAIEGSPYAILKQLNKARSSTPPADASKGNSTAEEGTRRFMPLTRAGAGVAQVEVLTHPSGSTAPSREPSGLFPSNPKRGLLRILRSESPSFVRDDSVGGVFGGGGVGPDEASTSFVTFLASQQHHQQQPEEEMVVLPALADVQLSMAYLRINQRVYRTEQIYEIHDSDDYGDDEHDHHGGGIDGHYDGGDASTPQLCIVCYHQPRNVILMPCNHFAFCMACVRRLSFCPVCREGIQFTLYLLQDNNPPAGSGSGSGGGV